MLILNALIMAKRYIIEGKQENSLPFVFQIRSLKSNTGTETFTAGSDYTLDSDVVGGGFETEQTRYIFSGNAPYNKAVVVGTLKIEASSDNYIHRSPYLNGSSNHIKLILTKVEKLSVGRESTKRNIYTFDIYYQNKIKTTITDNLVSTLIYSSTERSYKTALIHQITTGFEGTDQIIRAVVSATNINIYGTPGSDFGIAVNEHSLDVELKEDGTTATGRMIFNKADDTSILSSSIANDKATFYGKEIDIIKDTIGSKGVYSFGQKFPAAILESRTSAATSSSHTITIQDDTDNIKAGDKVKIRGVNKRLTVHSFPASKQIRLSDSFTVASGVDIKIERERSFGVEILPDLCSPLGVKIPTSRSIEIKQYPDILITFKTSTATEDFTITHQAVTRTYIDKSYGTGAIDNPHVTRDTEYSAFSTTPGEDHEYNVFAPAARSVRIPINVKLKLLGNGGKTFSTTRVPVFSAKTAISTSQPGTPSTPQTNGGSDWTNSIPFQNGGTLIDNMSNYVELSTVSATNDTCQVAFNFMITKCGTEDVTFELDLDKILTATTP
jgi:hypothetical protein